MKTYFPFLFCVFLLVTNTYAQEEINIKDLKTPDSPGFQILDIAPSSIVRPSNPKAFAASLVSLSNSGTIIPKNFAMEVSPYWYVKSDSASVYEYLSINKTANKETIDFKGFLSKMSLSIASTFSDSTSGSLLKNTNYLSFGIRTNLFTYRTVAQNQKLQNCLKQITDKMKEIKSNDVEKKKLIGMRNKLENEMDDEADPIKKAILASTIKLLDLQIDEIINVSSEKLEKKLEEDEETQKNIKKLNEVPFFQLDGAFAYSEAIPDNNYANKRFNRSGFWLNASLNTFSVDKERLHDNLSFMGTLRYISDNLQIENSDNQFQKSKAYDVGFRIEYTIKELSLSYEYLKRDYSNNNQLNSNRKIGTIQYQINDALYFTGSYGSNFGIEENLFVLFGINYGFGQSALKTM
jgi:hypothetical protein